MTGHGQAAIFNVICVSELARRYPTITSVAGLISNLGLWRRAMFYVANWGCFRSRQETTDQRGLLLLLSIEDNCKFNKDARSKNLATELCDWERGALPAI